MFPRLKLSRTRRASSRWFRTRGTPSRSAGTKRRSGTACGWRGQVWSFRRGSRSCGCRADISGRRSRVGRGSATGRTSWRIARACGWRHALRRLRHERAAHPSQRTRREPGGRAVAAPAAGHPRGRATAGAARSRNPGAGERTPRNAFRPRATLWKGRNAPSSSKSLSVNRP